MSYGIANWGTGSWGGADFVVIDHIPIDDATDVNRVATISFILYSQINNVVNNSINLIANGVYLIQNGNFTDNATGSIDSADPLSVIVTATVTHAFSPFELVNIEVSALNAANESPALGTTWSFTVNNTLSLFSNYIVRRFERVSRVNAVGLDAPQNPYAIVELAPPPNLLAEEV